MSIPLIQKPEKDDINTSIIAIKRNIERINMLLGLSNSEEIDTSKFATKDELQQAVTDLQPVDEVTSGNMHSVTSGAVYSALSALRTEYGFKIGNLMIETVSINIGTATFTNGRAAFYDVYNFIAPFTSVPNVVLSSQNDADYGFCTPIGIVSTKSKISTLSLFRDNNETVYGIFIKGIAIGT